MDRDQDVAQRAGRDPLGQEVADTLDVADRAGHLRAGHPQVRAVEPGLDERLAGRRLALGELVLVVREDQVDRTGVDVERRPEVLHAHRRALDMPARPARADRRLEARLAGLGTLPDGEVADVVLGVLVGLDPLAHPELLGIETGEAAVCRPRGDPEEDRAVAGLVGVAALDQRARSGWPSPGCGRWPGAGRRAATSAGRPRPGRTGRPTCSPARRSRCPWRRRRG